MITGNSLRLTGATRLILSDSLGEFQQVPNSVIRGQNNSVYRGIARGRLSIVLIASSFRQTWLIRYDTIRNAILTCAQKLI